ncbi:MAG: ABC transporter permease [Planctomycetota bacterium]
MRWRVVKAVAHQAFLEFWRSPQAVFWTYGFPLMMAVVLGFAFQSGEPDPVRVGVIDSEVARVNLKPLEGEPLLDVEWLSTDEADRALARGRVALTVRWGDEREVLRSDPTRPEAMLARLLVERRLREAFAGDTDYQRPVHEVEDRPGSRYIDFLIPGLIGLNLLGAGMWGVGFNLVQMRVGNLLRRIFVTPMKRSEFLAGYLLGRSILVIPEAFAIMSFGVFLWGVPFRGSLLAALVVIVVGAWTFTGLGCLLASRARTTETIGGLMNAVQLPMWVLGGTFFANEGLEGPMRWAAESMPLTHVNRALRDVMLEPGSLLDVWLPVTALAAAGLICFTLAMRWFRWQ